MRLLFLAPFVADRIGYHMQKGEAVTNVFHFATRSRIGRGVGPLRRPGHAR